jgi:hypothetical protein
LIQALLVLDTNTGVLLLLLQDLEGKCCAALRLLADAA